jgi:uncharacterized surface protein with fasciclin (FAS1) repeats
VTRVLGWVAACLVTSGLGGCALGDSTTAGTLAPIVVPRAPDGRGEPLHQSAPAVPASTGVVVNTDIRGLEPYPTMLWLLTASGVLDEIGGRPVTILAPSETAFRNFAAADHFGLMTNPAAFAPILRRHIVLGVYDSEELVAAGTVTNIVGEHLAVWRNGRVVNVAEITLTEPTTAALGEATVVVYGADGLLLLPEGSG